MNLFHRARLLAMPLQNHLGRFCAVGHHGEVLAVATIVVVQAAFGTVRARSPGVRPSVR